MGQDERQRIPDEEHVRLLGVFNYVFAGLLAFGVLMMALQLVLLRSVVFEKAHERIERPTETSRSLVPEGASDPRVMFERMEGVFTAFLIGWAVIMLAGAILSFMSARYLRSHRHAGFSQVVAGFQCLAVPLGTILGVFTFLVLGRASVKALYARGAPRPRERG